MSLGSLEHAGTNKASSVLDTLSTLQEPNVEREQERSGDACFLSMFVPQ